LEFVIYTVIQYFHYQSVAKHSLYCIKTSYFEYFYKLFSKLLIRMPTYVNFALVKALEERISHDRIMDNVSLT
jgi:hypothetical protein